MRKKIIAIVGPTASGKTALSIELAKKFGGEVVSCDSMQVYKFMNIGTAKITKSEMNGVPHHMLDVVDPRENYSVADFVRDARRCIDDVLTREKVPFLVGGTGLYVDSIINNVDFSEIKVNEKYRQYLKNLVNERGPEFLYVKLQEVDPESAKKIHPNNVRRVIRALEIFDATGKTISEQNSRQKLKIYDALTLGLNPPREILYKKINDRLDKMMADGLVDEVRNILKFGINRSNTSVQGIGYKEIADYLEDLAENPENQEEKLKLCAEKIKQNTRHYAKRQLTWFKKNKNIVWLDCQNSNMSYSIVSNFLKS